MRRCSVYLCPMCNATLNLYHLWWPWVTHQCLSHHYDDLYAATLCLCPLKTCLILHCVVSSLQNVHDAIDVHLVFLFTLHDHTQCLTSKESMYEDTLFLCRHIATMYDSTEWLCFLPNDHVQCYTMSVSHPWRPWTMLHCGISLNPLMLLHFVPII